MIETIDGFFAGVLHKVLIVLCKLTGRSNYFFAISALIVSFLIKFLYHGIRFSEHKFGVMSGFSWVLDIIFTALFIKLYHTDQKTVECRSEALNLSRFNGPIWQFLRVFYVVSNLGWMVSDVLVGENYLSSLSGIVFAISIYFAADTMPRGKGWLAKTMHKLITAAKKPMHLPSPIPHPPPVPS